MGRVRALFAAGHGVDPRPSETKEVTLSMGLSIKQDRTRWSRAVWKWVIFVTWKLKVKTCQITAHSIESSCFINMDTLGTVCSLEPGQTNQNTLTVKLFTHESKYMAAFSFGPLDCNFHKEQGCQQNVPVNGHLLCFTITHTHSERALLNRSFSHILAANSMLKGCGGE